MADLTKKLLAVTTRELPSYKLVNGPYPGPVHCALHFKTSSYQLLTVTNLHLNETLHRISYLDIPFGTT